MNSWIKNIAWLMFVVAIFVVMGFINSSKNNQILGLPDVKISVFEDQVFLTEDDIINRLKGQGLVNVNMRYSEVDINKVEQFLEQMNEVKSVKVFINSGNFWEVKIELKQAISRLFNLDGSSCYLDKDGNLLPTSINYSAHVLTVNGYINETDFTKNVETVINNDSLRTLEVLDDLYAISDYVCLSNFLSAQITHIYVNANKEFELIPRVGNQRILFGKAENIAGKFKKLEVFYKEGISNAGWNKYDTINIMYKNQVVCSKR